MVFLQFNSVLKTSINSHTHSIVCIVLPPPRVINNVSKDYCQYTSLVNKYVFKVQKNNCNVDVLALLFISLNIGKSFVVWVSGG